MSPGACTSAPARPRSGRKEGVDAKQQLRPAATEEAYELQNRLQG